MTPGKFSIKFVKCMIGICALVALGMIAMTRYKEYKAAYDEELFEPVYGRMLLAGERSGNMESVLERLAGLLEENCTNLVDRLVGVIDPLLSGILMVTVGLSLLSVMLPLIGMMNSVA